MSRPPRKTDDYRPRPRQARGTRWTDMSVARWGLFILAPSVIIAVPLALIAYGVALNLGYNPRRFLASAASNFVAPGGIGVVLVGLVFGLVKDAKAKHLVALEIDSDANAKLLRSRGRELARMLARQRRDHRRDIVDLRRDMEATIAARVDGAVVAIVAELRSAAPSRTGRMWAVPPAVAATAPPAPPVRDLPREIPMPPEPVASPALPVEDVRPYVPPAPPRTGSSAAGGRKLTPLDPEWTPPTPEPEPEPEERPNWGKSGPPSDAMTRFLTGQTDTYPAAEIESAARKWTFSEGEDE